MKQQMIDEGNPPTSPVLVVSASFQDKTSVYHYQAAQRFVRVTFPNPSYVYVARQVLERGLYLQCLDAQPHCFLTYESNVSFVMRFMVDVGLCGAGWISVTGGNYAHVRRPTSHCDLELQTR